MLCLTGLSGKPLIEALVKSRQDSFGYTLRLANSVMVYTVADMERRPADVTYYPCKCENLVPITLGATCVFLSIYIQPFCVQVQNRTTMDKNIPKYEWGETTHGFLSFLH